MKQQKPGHDAALLAVTAHEACLSANKDTTLGDQTLCLGCARTAIEKAAVTAYSSGFKAGVVSVLTPSLN